MDKFSQSATLPKRYCKWSHFEYTLMNPTAANNNLASKPLKPPTESDEDCAQYPSSDDEGQKTPPLFTKAVHIARARHDATLPATPASLPGRALAL
jgi:hypothetical protein